MHALVNSQLDELNKSKRGYEHRTGHRFPISFAKYTGEVKGDADARCKPTRCSSIWLFPQLVLDPQQHFGIDPSGCPNKRS